MCTGLYRWLVKFSSLGKLVSVFLWVELDFFSLECNEVSINELGDVYGFVVTLGSLYIGAQACVPVLLENLLGMSCPCVVLGFSVGMEAFDELLSINVPWSKDLDLSLLLPGIGLIFTVV